MSFPFSERGLNAISFHEATIVALQRNGSNIELRLEGVSSADGSRAATLVLENIVHCEIDGVVGASPIMEAGDGEVLKLTVRDDGIAMLIEWNEWETKSHFVRSYDLQADAVHVTLAP